MACGVNFSHTYRNLEEIPVDVNLIDSKPDDPSLANSLILSHHDLAPAAPSKQPCPEHPDSFLELFCIQTQSHLCAHCLLRHMNHEHHYLSYKELSERELAVTSISDSLSQLSLDFQYFHDSRMSRIHSQQHENAVEMNSINAKIDELEK